jgi:taurine dioxygenase
MWDNIGTVHNAVPDYCTDEPRYMRRVQVMATKPLILGHALARAST